MINICSTPLYRTTHQKTLYLGAGFIINFTLLFEIKIYNPPVYSVDCQDGVSPHIRMTVF